MPRTRPPYPEEFKREAIKLVGISSKSQHQIAEDLGISDVTLRNWVKQAERDEGKRPDGLSSDEREELARLRRENRRCGWSARTSRRQPLFSPGRPASRRRDFFADRGGEGELSGLRMCRALGVNRTSFHDWQRRAPSDRELTDAWLTEKIKQIHADSTAPMAPGGSTPSCGSSTDPRRAQARRAADEGGRYLRASAAQASAHHRPAARRQGRSRPGGARLSP